MKKYLSMILLVITLIVMFIIGTSNKEIKTSNIVCSDDILRIHIRANSNSDKDQSLKYNVKDLLLEYISEDIVKLESKEEVKEYFIINKQDIEHLLNTYLKSKGENYTVNIKISKEFFPVRMYGNNVVESGEYEAVIFELGKSEGANWWCIAYPTLCFEDYQNLEKDIEYKSRILDIIKKIKG